MAKNDLRQYERVRSKLLTGDVFAFHGTGPLSWAIEGYTKSYYSHVAMALWIQFNEEKQLMLVHAVYPAGVVIVHARQYISTYRGKIDAYRINPEKMEDSYPGYQGKLADWSAQQAGREYDVRGVVAFLAPFFNQQTSQYFCSELIASAWKEALGINIDPKITPGALVARPEFFDHVPIVP